MILTPTFPSRSCTACIGLGRACLSHIVIRDRPAVTLTPVFPDQGEPEQDGRDHQQEGAGMIRSVMPSVAGMAHEEKKGKVAA